MLKPSSSLERASIARFLPGRKTIAAMVTGTALLATTLFQRPESNNVVPVKPAAAASGSNEGVVVKPKLDRALIIEQVKAQGPLTRADFENGVTIGDFSLKLDKTENGKQKLLNRVVVNGRKWQLAGLRSPADMATLSFSNFAYNGKGTLDVRVNAKVGILPVPQDMSYNAEQLADLIISLAEGNDNITFYKPAQAEGEQPKDTGADLVLVEEATPPQVAALEAGNE